MVSLAANLVLLDVADRAAEARALENLGRGNARTTCSKPKVRNLETPVGSDEDVLRLQVKVDDAVVVHVANTVGNVASNLPNAAFVHALVALAVHLEESSKRADARLGLNVELSILLPCVNKLEDVVVGSLGQVTKDVNLLQVAESDVSGTS